MTKLEKIVLLMAFWTSPWGAAKAAMWEFFSHDRPMTEEVLLEFIGYIVNGVDDSRMSWNDLESFKLELLGENNE